MHKVRERNSRERMSPEFAAPLLAKAAERIDGERDRIKRKQLLDKYSLITRDRTSANKTIIGSANYIPYYHELPILLDLSGLTVKEWYSLSGTEISEPIDDMAELYAALKYQSNALLREIRDWAVLMAPNVWRQFDRREQSYKYKQVTYKLELFISGQIPCNCYIPAWHSQRPYSDDILSIISKKSLSVKLATSRLPDACNELGASLYWILGLDDPSFGNELSNKFTIFADKRIQEEIVKLYTFMSESDKPAFLEAVKSSAGCLKSKTNEEVL